jgi:hypothetical protein
MVKFKRTITCLFGLPLIIIIITSLVVYRLHDILESEKDHSYALGPSKPGRQFYSGSSIRPRLVPIIEDVAITQESISSTDYELEKTKLPSFANDETEFIVGSIIERSSQSMDLFATTFMLCHYMLDSHNAEGVQEVHSAIRDTWQRAMLKFEKVKYLASGSRRQEEADEKFFCKIKHSSFSTAYIVPGYFMPNRLTDDSHNNRKLDIMRCPIMDPLSAYAEFSGSSQVLSIEILRGNVPIIEFTIPWSTRKTGFLLSSPPAASTLNSWKGYDTNQTLNSKKEPIDKLHICVPSTNQIPSKNELPLFLEFVSHHLLIGVSHIHLPVNFEWNSVHMNRYIDVFKTYIQEGKVSIISQSDDGFDSVGSIGGATFHKVFKMFR